MALSTEHRIYAAVVVLAALGGGVYMMQKDQKAEDAKYTASARSADLPEFKLAADDVDKINKIEIKNADKGDVTLEKVDGNWRVKKPIDYLAQQQNIKTLLDNLKELKGKELIDKSPQSYAEYAVDDAKAVHVVLYKDGAKSIDLFFGKSGGRGQMARKAGADGVYAITGYSSYLYTRELKGWRDNAIAKFEDDKVARVDLENENGSFVFKKDGEAWTGTLKKDKIERFDEAKVKDLLRAYKTLTAEDYGDGKSDADTGLDKPAATLTFTMKEGDPVKLLIGKTSAGESRFVKKDGGSQVFVISSWAAGWGVAKAEKFQKAEEKKDDKDKKDKDKDKDKDKKDDKKKDEKKK